MNNSITLTPEEKKVFDSILELKQAELEKVISALVEEFGLGASDVAEEEVEVKVEEKRTFKIKISNLGTAQSKIPCIRVLQTLFQGVPLGQIMGMYALGELDKEFINKEEAEKTLALFNNIGFDFKAEPNLKFQN